MANMKIVTETQVKEFLKRDEIQKLLRVNDLGEIYRIYIAECLGDIDGYLLSIGVDSKEFLTPNDYVSLTSNCFKDR